jgi:death-on-curing protein
MRYPSLSEVIELHRLVILQSGGSDGIRDLGALKSAVAQPRMTFDAVDLYRTIEEKAASLCYSLVMNHPFVDGNKRVGHAAMETLLVLNGWALEASVEESERVMLAVASGTCRREQLANWIGEHIVRLPAGGV